MKKILLVLGLVLAGATARATYSPDPEVFTRLQSSSQATLATATELSYLTGTTALIEPRFSLLSSQVVGLQGATSTFATQISALQGATATQATQIAGLQGVTGSFLVRAGDTMSGNLGLSGSSANVNTVLTLNSSRVVSSSAVTTTELGYLSGATANIQTQINGISTYVDLSGITTNIAALQGATTYLNNGLLGLQGTTAATAASIAGKVSKTGDTMSGNLVVATLLQGATVNAQNVVANRALFSDASKNISSSTTTDTELGYVAGTTANIQTQLNAKLSGADISGITTNIAALQGATSTLQTGLNAVSVQVQGVSSSVVANTAAITGVSTQLQGVSSAVAQLQGTTAATASAIASNTSAITGVSTQLQGVSSSVVANAVSVNAVSVQVQGVSSSVAALTSTVSGKVDRSGDTMTGGLGLNYVGVTAASVPYLDAARRFTSSAVTPTELSYLSGTTAAIQTQLNAIGAISGFTTPTSGSTYGNTTAPSISGTNNTAIGILSGVSVSSGNGNTLYGRNSGNSLSTGNNATFIGNNAGPLANGGGSVGVGASALAALSTGANNVAIGLSSGGTVQTGGNSVYIGNGTGAVGVTSASAIALGAFATADSNEFVVGSNTARINDIYVGRGRTNTSVNMGVVTLQPTAATGTDVSGGNSVLQIAGARGTGTGSGGPLNFLTAPAGLTGTTLNTLVTRLSIADTGAINVPGLTASTVVTADGSKNLVSSAVTTTELGYLSGASSSIQTQLNTLTAASVNVSGITTQIAALQAVTGGFVLRAGDTMTGGLGLNYAGVTANTATIIDAARKLVSSPVTSTELAFLSGATAAIQPQITTNTASIAALQGVTGSFLAKAGDTMTGNLGLAGTSASVNTALFLNASRVVSSSATTSTELGYLSGATGAIQPQLNGKIALSTVTTKGDLIVGVSAAGVTRLPIGVNGQVLVADSLQATGQKWANAPQGLKNYVVNNPDLEQGSTTGFSLGTATLDATTKTPSGVPTFGSGASGNLSLTSVSTGVLAGSYSMGYVSSAATTAGNFVATNAFTVDPEGQAKPMQFKIAYSAITNPANGNFSGTNANSFGVAIYDVTNSIWIQPAGVFNVIQNSGVGIATGTFQTSITGTSYRMVFYNANATSGAITMYLDDVFVGPQITAGGAAASSTATYAPVLKGSTNGSTFTNQTTAGNWYRAGDRLRGNIYTAYTGAPGTGTGSFIWTLPAGLTVDTAKLPTSTSNTISVGSAKFLRSGVQFYVGTVTYNSAQGGGLSIAPQGSASTEASPTVPATVASGDFVSIEFDVPASGWDAQTVMSNDTDTRVVALNVFKSTTQSLTTSVETLITGYNTPGLDTHAGFNPTTGLYTVPVAGNYAVSAATHFTSNATGLRYNVIYKNGGVYQYGNVLNATSGDGTGLSTSVVIPCVPGDTISMGAYQTSGGALTIRALNNATGLNIQRISGPATVAATEAVGAYYNSGAGQAIAASGAFTIVDFGSKVFDTHNAVTTGASWKFTAPVSGRYRVSSNVRFANGLSFSAGGFTAASLYKNGAAYATNDNNIWVTGVFNTGPSAVLASPEVYLNAGDYVDIRSAQNESGTRALVAATTLVWVSIERVGN